MLEKRSRIILLKDFYGPLLTDKQRDVMSLHYENDWSLAEIADQMDITRQGVYDILKRAEAALHEYESRLGLVGRFLETRCRLQEVYELILEQPEATEKDKALQILEEINDML